jgi:uncharacterized protein with ParB-like and HNH nuclease domain/predicted transport protein
MKAQDLQFTQLIQGAKQFIIPIFQRNYSWNIGHCEQLWSDIIRNGSDSRLDSHFIGSVVYIPEQDTSAAISRWIVVDGQQRITTLTLILLAFMRRLQGEELDKPVSAAEIKDYFLINRYGKEEQRYKLLLTETDKDTLIALLKGKENHEIGSQRILENLRFFTERIADTDLNVVYQGIQKLMIVDVRLQHGVDNPQMIFESMNSTGKELTQADLIRNFVLMALSIEQQNCFYNDYWRPMEVLFGAESYNILFDEFMRFFLVIHTGNYRIKKNEVYAEFKAYSCNFEIEELLVSLKEYAEYYCCIALGKETDAELDQLFQNIRELRADVCYPLLIEVYADYSLKILSKQDFIEILLLVESYVFRRAICEIPTNSLRQTFATFNRKLKKDRYLESIKAIFLLLPSYRRFPKDEEFLRQIKLRNLYAFNRRTYWLRRFENFNRKELINVQNLTIEHIMPQNEMLSEEWKADLGEDWQRIHEEYLHTLGNLTLTAYNSEYSNYSFNKKRDMENGFSHSPLKLNDWLGNCDVWNESKIKERANRLAKKAREIWKAPSLEEEVLEDYKDSKASSDTIYSIADHDYLQDGSTRSLFDKFRLAVLELDQCVHEEYLKYYVAYKAETNFVDVVPQASRLRLNLNMNFPEIDDPRGLCRDLTNISHWANGNIEIGFERIEDLPYVIGLVRQSLERQLGEDEHRE